MLRLLNVGTSLQLAKEGDRFPQPLLSLLKSFAPHKEEAIVVEDAPFGTWIWHGMGQSGGFDQDSLRVLPPPLHNQDGRLDTQPLCQRPPMIVRAKAFDATLSQRFSVSDVASRQISEGQNWWGEAARCVPLRQSQPRPQAVERALRVSLPKIVLRQ
jgi:hypothetical protein